MCPPVPQAIRSARLTCQGALAREVGNVLGPTFDYDVMPDGRFVAAASSSADVNRQQIQIVLNWTEELKRVVPTK